VFELQLMPSLMQLTIEAAQMALEQELPVDTAGEIKSWVFVVDVVGGCTCCHVSKTAGRSPVRQRRWL
jgi:hypothetical protein